MLTLDDIKMTQADRDVIQFVACRKANREVGRDYRTQGSWYRVYSETLARMRAMAYAEPVR